jgi:hypothetical protein
MARELTKLVHPEKQQNSAKAMGDLFTLYGRLQQKDSRLLDTVRGVVRRSLAAERDRRVSENQDKEEKGSKADSSSGA